jgi:hypothetical protein
MVLDALITAAFGSTPGKAVAGIVVRDLRGSRLPIAALVRRNAGVWWWGLGAGIPIVNLFTMLASNRRLEANHLTIWDEVNGSRCFARSDSSVRTALAALFALCTVVGVTGYSVYLNNPKNILSVAVRSVQDMAPQMVDSETRLDGAEAGPNGELIYKYTLVSVSPATHDLNATRSYLVTDFAPTVISSVCDDANLTAILSAGVDIVYRYSDAEGTSLGSVRVGAADCLQRVN